jgi:hypothetical protein
MKLTDKDIDGAFSDSILLKYLESVVQNKQVTDIISELTFRLQMFDPANDKTTTIEAIDIKKVEYLVLVTKLSTMVEMFKVMQGDDNLVMVDYLEKEIKRFEDTISASIVRANNEVIDK